MAQSSPKRARVESAAPAPAPALGSTTMWTDSEVATFELYADNLLADLPIPGPSSDESSEVNVMPTMTGPEVGPVPRGGHVAPTASASSAITMPSALEAGPSASFHDDDDVGPLAMVADDRVFDEEVALAIALSSDVVPDVDVPEDMQGLELFAGLEESLGLTGGASLGLTTAHDAPAPTESSKSTGKDAKLDIGARKFLTSKLDATGHAAWTVLNDVYNLGKRLDNAVGSMVKALTDSNTSSKYVLRKWAIYYINSCVKATHLTARKTKYTLAVPIAEDRRLEFGPDVLDAFTKIRDAQKHLVWKILKLEGIVPNIAENQFTLDRAHAILTAFYLLHPTEFRVHDSDDGSSRSGTSTSGGASSGSFAAAV
jgi:hypothetical protein